MPYIPNGGGRLHYPLVLGGSAAGDNPPLLLLHGFLQGATESGAVQGLSRN